MVEPGTHIGRYEVLTRIAGGEHVYLARDPLQNRAVAIRLLGESRPAAPSAELLDRRREAALLSFRHPHIAALIEVVEFESRIFAITAFITGRPLELLIQSREQLVLADKLRWIEEVVGAVKAAHDEGIVHGHISPRMVMIDEQHAAHVLGFDVELLPGAQTLSGFEAPEVIAGRSPVPASDVFSVAALAHALLTASSGREPVLHSPSKPYEMTPIEKNVIVHDGVVRLIELALHAEPDERVVRIQDLEIAFADARGRLEQFLAEHTARRESPVHTDISKDIDLPKPSPPAGLVAPQLEQVQFTVYRPKAVRPGEWRPMLAYVHLADLPPDAPANASSPIEQVRTLAERALGNEIKTFRDSTVEATQDVPREGEITIVPTVVGIEFNPERRTFKWVQDVQEEKFLLRARPAFNGRIARGRVSAYLGVLLIAEVELAIRVDAALAETATAPVDVVRARAFRNIFASYSHADSEIVRQFEAFAATLGDRYLRDVRDLRAGQAWQPALLRLIDRADVFQLFWSSTAMRSPNVRQEWEYALSLKREDFVRPTYWEEPLPCAPHEGLPPATLTALQFQRISFNTASTATPPAGSVAEGSEAGSSAQAPRITINPIPKHVNVDEEAQARMRAATVAGTLARAADLLNQRKFQQALAVCDEALAIDAAASDALQLRARVWALLEAEERLHERESIDIRPGVYEMDAPEEAVGWPHEERARPLGDEEARMYEEARRHEEAQRRERADIEIRVHEMRAREEADRRQQEERESASTPPPASAPRVAWEPIAVVVFAVVVIALVLALLLAT